MFDVAENYNVWLHRLRSTFKLWREAGLAQSNGQLKSFRLRVRSVAAIQIARQIFFGNAAEAVQSVAQAADTGVDVLDVIAA